MEVHIARVSKTGAAVDNGDGTETIFVTNNGVQSFKLDENLPFLGALLKKLEAKK